MEFQLNGIPMNYPIETTQSASVNCRTHMKCRNHGIFPIKLVMTHTNHLFQHVVFGSVVEGMNVVKEIERVGSQSGKTSRPVKIEASGQL